MTDLPSVRRLEAVAFRAWPAASVLYDGSWLIRLTAGHDSKRLNSLNPLDPSDTANIAVRLEKAARRFADYGRPLTVRQTPLTPLSLVSHMDEQGWSSLGETIVMRVDLTVSDPGDGMDHLPIRDVGRFVDARLAVSGEDAFRKAGLKPGLSEIINAIKPERGMFLFEDAKSGPEAVCLAVQDNDMAGILQMIVRKDLRRQGIGAAILGTSLRWARLRGAKTAWLQVEADNAPAIAMYRTFGFGDVYRYTYRRPAVVGAAA